MKTLEELGISPVPWRTDLYVYGYVTTSIGFHVATADGDTPDERRANANIIAAAPELYAELIKAVEFIDQVGNACGGLPIDVIQNQNAARKALAKAAGEEGGDE